MKVQIRALKKKLIFTYIMVIYNILGIDFKNIFK